MTQDVEELPRELTRALFQLGGRKLVFVEGPSDEDTFNIWFQERLQDVYFFPAGGYQAVEKGLQQIALERPDINAYGIRDRDFCTAEVVQDALNISSTHLFILTRYSIENYLLEPQAMLDEMSIFMGAKNPFRNTAEVEEKLLDLCRQLRTLMAANWILLENEYAKLPYGFEKLEKTALVEVVVRQIVCEPDAAEVLLDEKEALIQPSLETLETAHTHISGKYLLHQFYIFVAKKQRGWTKDYLLRLLARRIKEVVGIHSDIRFIVEKRILGDP